MKELVERIVKSLVDNPDKVKVTQLDGEQSSIIELTVALEDMGKVIGKQGRNAQAIRVILGAAGMKLKRRVNLEILEKG
ncbi:MAG: KH domain-containing protein [Candidatus Aminicenantales bacterium]